MEEKLSRRDFLGTMGSAAAASVVLTPLAQSVPAAQNTRGTAVVLSKTTPYKKVVLEPFDYAGVTLRQSLWQRQASAGRDFYLGLPNDDILHGYRVAAGAANAPGRALGGWCQPQFQHRFRPVAPVHGAHAARLRRQGSAGEGQRPGQRIRQVLAGHVQRRCARRCDRRPEPLSL